MSPVRTQLHRSLGGALLGEDTVGWRALRTTYTTTPQTTPSNKSTKVQTHSTPQTSVANHIQS